MTRLRRSRISGPGIHRRRAGTGFHYTAPDGATLDDEGRERVDALAVPPAWQDVWIAPDPLGHIQATGVDAAGRRQYLYHPQWREGRDKRKFARALELAVALPSARAAVTRDLRGDDERARVLAAAFRLLDEVSPRVGGERYLETNGSHGLTTLVCSHVSVRGDRVALAFVGKGGLDWEAEVRDADLARVLRVLAQRGPRARLLAWGSDGEPHIVSASEVNEYIRERTGIAASAKDFRTLRGTIVAADSLAASGTSTVRRERRAAITRAFEDAAAALGNTPTIARTSYVDPRVVERYRRGRVIAATGAREPALLALIGAPRRR